MPLSRRAACVRGFLDLPLSYHYGFCVDKWALVLVSSPPRPGLFAQAEWDDVGTKQRCRVFYRSLAECADLLYKRVASTARIGDVFTTKEIRAELPPAFSAALDDYAIGKVLALMEDDGRARTFERGVRNMLCCLRACRRYFSRRAFPPFFRGAIGCGACVMRARCVCFCALVRVGKPTNDCLPPRLNNALRACSRGEARA